MVRNPFEVESKSNFVLTPHMKVMNVKYLQTIFKFALVVTVVASRLEALDIHTIITPYTLAWKHITICLNCCNLLVCKLLPQPIQ